MPLDTFPACVKANPYFSPTSLSRHGEINSAACSVVKYHCKLAGNTKGQLTLAEKEQRLNRTPYNPRNSSSTEVMSTRGTDYWLQAFIL